MRRVILLLCFICTIHAQFEVPDARVEILEPRGFTVSIPDIDGIKLFAFHGKINEELIGREGGVFSRDITKAKDGRWTFIDKTTKLKPGDILYYWTYVDYFDGERKLGYPKDDQQYVVPGVPTNNGQNKPVTQTPPPNVDQSNTQGYVEKPVTNRPSNAPCTSKSYSTRVNGKEVCSGVQIFSETFEHFDQNKWQTEIKFAGEPDYEFVIYLNNKNNLFVRNNELHIKPLLADDIYGNKFVELPQGLNLGVNCTGVPDTTDCKQTPGAFIILPPVISARINTKSSFSFVYGIIDVRAKLPKGDWIYPELYLTPKRYAYGPGYNSGEIRIAFLPGNSDSDTELQGGCIIGTSPEAREYGMRKINKDISWSDDFHVFSVRWKPDVITLLVDNVVYGNVYPPVGGFSSALPEDKLNASAINKWRQGDLMAPFDKEMYITVGVGVGGHCFPDRPNVPKPYLNTDPKAQKRFYSARNVWKQTWNTGSELVVDYINVQALI